MWRVIYNFLFAFSLPFLTTIGLTNNKIRKNFFERLFPSPAGHLLDGALWIHAASIGEAAIAENILLFLKKSGYQKNFFLTTNTFYTKDLLIKKFGGTIPVRALPFDLFFSMKRFLGKYRPSGLVIVETEIWPNLIWQVSDRNCPVIIVNARISDKTFHNYKRLSFFMTAVLGKICKVITQSREQEQRFVTIGMDQSRVITSGNIKYFREIPEYTASSCGVPVITYGSVKEKELDFIYESVEKVKSAIPRCLIFIAPRELHLSSAIEKKLMPLYPVMRYSVCKKNLTCDNSVVIVDTVGDLLRVYSMSTVAFVGGSLAPYGGQNLLEPLFFGTPVLFGPYTDNFREITDIIKQKNAGLLVKNGSELTSGIMAIINDTDLREQMGIAGKEIISAQEMVMVKTINLLQECLSSYFESSSPDEAYT